MNSTFQTIMHKKTALNHKFLSGFLYFLRKYKLTFRELNISLFKAHSVIFRLMRVLKVHFRYLLYDPLFLQALHHD